MLEFLVVGTGGFVGCCLRFWITKLMMPLGGQFPFATLCVNVLAGFLIGALMELEKNVGWITPGAKLFLTTGMLGGLSTFSTFSVESINLFSEGQYLSGTANVLLNVALSFTGVILGMMMVRVVFRKIAIGS